MSGPGNEQGGATPQRAPEPDDSPVWRLTASRQPGGVQRSDADQARAGRADSSTSEFGNPAGLWLG